MNIRKDFPFFKSKDRIIYLDNAAATQKPQQVIDAIVDYYTNYCSNVGRGGHELGETATSMFNKAREKIAKFIGADFDEIIFTKNTTAGINFIASTWGFDNIKKGDEILISELEHHSNLIPWQQLAKEKGALLKFIPVKENGTLDLEQLPKLLTNKTKLVAVSYVSNALGTTTDIKTIIKKAHEVDAKFLIDASQAAPHKKIEVHKLGCDFLVFSSHKLFGPTGIGILYIKKSVQDEVYPYQYGGGMIYEADFCDASFLPSPQKYESGTPPIAQAIGFGAAIDYFTENINFKELQKHEAQLCTQLIEGLQKIPGIKVLGPIDQLKKSGHIVSFIMKDVHPHDIAALLNKHGIAVRAGHHCVQPLAKKMGIPSSVRVSFHGYNTSQEVEKLLSVLQTFVQE